MRIHIIKVLKYTNSILARFSSGPFLPPLVFGTKSERVCSIEWDHRERGMDRCCSECRAPLSCRPAALQPCRCRKKQNFSNYSSSSSSSASACWRSVGNREGSEERVQEGAEGTLFIVGRTKEEEGLSKEGGTKCFRIA